MTTRKVAQHDLAQQVVRGTPRHPPFVMFCRIPLGIRWCGRHWVANSVEDYELLNKHRDTHESLCSALAVATVK